MNPHEPLALDHLLERLIEPPDPAGYVVHFPLPDALRQDRDERVAAVAGVEHLLLVGSPARARKAAEWARDALGARVGCYCDLMVPGRAESEREFALYGIHLPGGPSIGVASHGVGLSGVELVLSEVPALLSVIAGHPVALRGVVRAGTRGGLLPVPLGTIAISAEALDDEGRVERPDEHLLRALRACGVARGMFHATQREAVGYVPQQSWPATPPHLLLEGPVLSSSFFWEGQGRPHFNPGLDPARAALEKARRILHLTHLRERGICWIEMEDYTVLRLCRQLGYPAVTLGAVIASRQRTDGTFQVDYSHEAYLRSERIPVELAVATFQHIHSQRP